jgi:hypothetical protein
MLLMLLLLLWLLSAHAMRRRGRTAGCGWTGLQWTIAAVATGSDSDGSVAGASIGGRGGARIVAHTTVSSRV